MFEGNKTILNDWEDGHYLFVASYCDELRTLDKDTAIAAKTMYPRVCVISCM